MKQTEHIMEIGLNKKISQQNYPTFSPVTDKYKQLVGGIIVDTFVTTLNIKLWHRKAVKN